MEKATTKELAVVLLNTLEKWSNNFTENFGQLVQAHGVVLDETSMKIFEREAYIINLWIFSKTLGSERRSEKESRLFSGSALCLLE